MSTNGYPPPPGRYHQPVDPAAGHPYPYGGAPPVGQIPVAAPHSGGTGTRWLPPVIVAIVLVVLAAGITAAVLLIRPGTDQVGAIDSATPQAEVTEDGAIVLGGGPVVVDVYVDYICPVCSDFDRQFGAEIDQYIAQDQIAMHVHPLGLLDGYTSTRYSTRSASAAVCAADQGRFREYEKVLFANQPPENGAGLSDEELAGLGSGIGLNDDFANCVAEQTYQTWVTDRTDETIADGITSTPTIKIDNMILENRSQFTDTVDNAILDAG